MGDMTIRNENRAAQIDFREDVQSSGTHLQSGWESAGQFGWEDAECKQSVVEGREDLQKQRCSVDSEMQKNGGSSLQCILFREQKGCSDPRQNQGMGEKGYETFCSD